MEIYMVDTLNIHGHCQEIAIIRMTQLRSFLVLQIKKIKH